MAYFPLFGPVPHKLELVFLQTSVSNLDKRYRRRTLSRTHIRDIFDWAINTDGLDRALSAPSPTETAHIPFFTPTDSSSNSQPPFPNKPQTPCQNYTEPTHPTSACHFPCGHCGAPNPSASPNDPCTSPPPSTPPPHWPPNSLGLLRRLRQPPFPVPTRPAPHLGLPRPLPQALPMRPPPELPHRATAPGPLPVRLRRGGQDRE